MHTRGSYRGIAIIGAVIMSAGCAENHEPIAVVHCSAMCVDVGETVTFRAEDSYDPDGDELRYHFDFGDGQSSLGPRSDHVYSEPGARRVVLTVTDPQGASDTSSCVVSVGRFPQSVPYLDELVCKPNHFNPAIKEKGVSPLHGGLLLGLFISPFDAIPDLIVLNGRPVRSGESETEWCEVVQPTLRAGEVGILRCHSNSAELDPGSRVTVEVRAGDRIVWWATRVLTKPALTLAYLTSTVDGTGMLIHVRNEADVSIELTGVSLDGVDVSAFALISSPVLAPSEIAVIEIPRCDGIPYGRWTVVTIRGNAAGVPLSISGATRLFPPVFPIGDWNSGDDDVFNNMEHLQRYLDVGINMFIYDPTDPSTPPERVLPLADLKDFYVFTHKGSLDGGYEQFEAFVHTWGSHPRLLTNAVSGEGEFSGTAGKTLQTVRMHRALWGNRKPLWVYNACSYSFPSWGPLADMGGMDHYCVMAPKCNTGNTPPFYWDHIEFAGYYAEEIKRACEPGPVWNWTQSLSNTWEIRCTSDAEMRAQWYQVLSRGTRGMLWFQYKLSWLNRCPEKSVLELIRLAQELDALKQILLEGEPALPGVVVSTSDPKVGVSATVAPHGVAIFLSNLNYGIRLLLPYIWFPRLNVEVQFTPPEWFEPMHFFLLDGDRKMELFVERIHTNAWLLHVPTLDVAAAILVEPEP